MLSLISIRDLFPELMWAIEGPAQKATSAAPEAESNN
jgi:hypothetical protein